MSILDYDGGDGGVGEATLEDLPWTDEGVIEDNLGKDREGVQHRREALDVGGFLDKAREPEATLAETRSTSCATRAQDAYRAESRTGSDDGIPLPLVFTCFNSTGAMTA